MTAGRDVTAGGDALSDSHRTISDILKRRSMSSNAFYGQ